MRAPNVWLQKKCATTFISTKENCIFHAPYISIGMVSDIYDHFTVKALCLFHLVISKRLKECTIAY